MFPRLKYMHVCLFVILKIKNNKEEAFLPFHVSGLGSLISLFIEGFIDSEIMICLRQFLMSVCFSFTLENEGILYIYAEKGRNR